MPSRNDESAAPPSTWRSAAVAGALASLLFAVVFFLTNNAGEVFSTAWTLGVFSVLTFLGWLLMGCAIPVFEDEADQYEIGADSTWVFVVVPLGMSLAWILAMLFTMSCRTLLQQELFTATLKWHGLVFTSATGAGLAMLCVVPRIRSQYHRHGDVGFGFG